MVLLVLRPRVPMTISGSLDPLVVALSIMIAVAASYTALDLATRARASSHLAHAAWLAAAAIAMGGGVWSMHFVGMLAFSLPDMEIRYGLGLTLASLALPIGVCGLGFAVASRPRFGAFSLLASGLFVGLGIAGMHYLGMAAMHLPAELTHDEIWVALSIAIAIGAATLAISLVTRDTGPVERIGAAMVMGAAISGMHYAAMAGAHFELHAHEAHTASLSVADTHLALWIATTTLLILGLALVASVMDRHHSLRVAREAAQARDSEERLDLLLESLTDYVIIGLDAQGRVTRWPQSARRVMGFSAAEVIGSHVSRFHTQAAREAGAADRELRIAAEEGRFEEEGERVRRDGTAFEASVVVHPMRGPDGRLVGFAKVVRDVTEPRRAQRELESAREALAQAQKTEAIGQLTGGVAHDFNNLLMAITSSLELLQKRLPPDPRLARLVGNAMQGAERGVALTRRMLAFARRQHLEPQPVNLAALVYGMTELLQRTIGPGIRIETRFPLSLPSAKVDAHQLELAILNLTVNARDAMPNGGTVVIGGREAEGVAEGLGEVCLFVSDEGVGMDAQTLARAREPFFTTKGVGKGTGLGLSMVHGLAEQSRGRLVLESVVRQGTTAEIWLPIAEANLESASNVVAFPSTSAARHEPSRDAAATEGRRHLIILVVDDDPLVLESTAAMLEELGHVVLEARSGEEALSLLRQTRTLDLVVTDYAMPGLDGLEVARQIAEVRPGIPVVLASGYAELSDEPSASLTRLAKPFTQEARIPTVSAAL